jgi:isopentenyl phosphate kinase
MKLGLVPISFGDVVPDSKLGFSICSGDQIMLRLVRELEIEQAIFVTDVDGVFSENPSTNKKARLLPMLDRETLDQIDSTEASAPDVTGGIREKLWLGLEIAKLGVESVILNGSVRGRLRDALLGLDIICSVIPANGGNGEGSTSTSVRPRKK